MSLLVLYTPLEWSFISIQVFVLNLGSWFVYCLANLLFIDIPLLSSYTNLNSSIICFLFSADTYISFGNSNSFLAWLFCGDFEILVMLSVILSPIKVPVASAVFWIAVFEAVFVVDCLEFCRFCGRFWLYLFFIF